MEEERRDTKKAGSQYPIYCVPLERWVWVGEHDSIRADHPFYELKCQ